MPRDARRTAEPDDTGGDTWAAVLAAWDVAPGSSSEAALATAVLLDAHRHTRSVIEAARVALARGAVHAAPPDWVLGGTVTSEFKISFFVQPAVGDALGALIARRGAARGADASDGGGARRRRVQWRGAANGPRTGHRRACSVVRYSRMPRTTIRAADPGAPVLGTPDLAAAAARDAADFPARD